MDFKISEGKYFWRCLLMLSVISLLNACGGGGSPPAAQPDNGGKKVDPNSPPVLSQLKIGGSPTTSVHQRDAYQFIPTIKNAKGSVSFSVSNKPQWATFNPGNGELSGTADVGVTQGIVISATDSAVTTSLPGFDLEVIASNNNKPNISSLPLTTVGENQHYRYHVAALDPDKEDSLTYHLRVAPRGMTIDATGLIEWTPFNGDRGSHPVAVEVLDNGNPAYAVAQEFTLSVNASINLPIPQAGWQLRYVDSEEQNNAAINAFDGDAKTMWHTQFTSKLPPPPHEIQINLGAAYDVSGFRYLPRQDTNQPSGRIAEYEFYTSMDGVNWGEPVAVGRFVNSGVEKEVLFPTVTASYVKVIAVRSVHASAVTSMAELNVLGALFSGNYAPKISIDLPLADITIGPGESLKFAATATDQANNSPLTVRWDFGEADFPASSLEDPGSIKFAVPGTFVIRANVMDAAGRVDTTPAQRIVKVQSRATIISPAKTSIHYVDSEDNTVENGAAANAIDANPATAWSTASLANESRLPHEIQVNLGSAYAVDSLRYTPPQATSGRIGQYRVFVSEDGNEWGDPVKMGSFRNDTSEQQIFFPPKLGQFVRVLARTDLNGGQRSAAAELRVEGSCVKPYVKLLQPTTRALFSATSLTLKSSVCLNPTLHAGFGIKYVVDGGIAGTVHDSPYTLATTLSNSEHVIEAYIVDAQGKAISGTSIYDKATSVGVGDYYVAFGDSITYGAGDDDATDNISRDGRNTEGGFTAILNDLLTSAMGKPHAVANEGVPGDLAADGVAHLATVLKRHSQAQFFLLLFGTNDSSGMNPVPSGVGIKPGDAGYTGSYKDFMQQMIDIIKFNGRQAYLAKVPAQTNATRNQRISAYNQVIDELVIANSIAITPPDFFTYFATRTGQFSDGIHPNGAGYKEMARLWLEALRR